MSYIDTNDLFLMFVMNQEGEFDNEDDCDQEVYP